MYRLADKGRRIAYDDPALAMTLSEELESRRVTFQVQGRDLLVPAETVPIDIINRRLLRGVKLDVEAFVKSKNLWLRIKGGA